MGSRKLVFAYGTTMHRKYMRGECPHARLVGVGKLKGWKWVINSKKYANIVETSDGWSSSSDEVVYGLVWSLTPHDFKRLGRSERHRSKRKKEKISIRLKKRHHSSYKKKKVYVWYDAKHESSGHRAHSSYRHRMRKALKSARHQGVPKKYIKKVEKKLKKGHHKSHKHNNFTDLTDVFGSDSASDSDFFGGHRRRWDSSDWDDSDGSESSWMSRSKKSYRDDLTGFSSSWV